MFVTYHYDSVFVQVVRVLLHFYRSHFAPNALQITFLPLSLLLSMQVRVGGIQDTYSGQ